MCHVFPVNIRISRIPLALVASILFGMCWSVAAAAEAPASPVAGTADGIIIKWRMKLSGREIEGHVASAAGVAQKRGITLRYERSGALGTHVLKLDRARPTAEVEALAREIKANDPDVERSEADRIMRPDSPLL
jgi:hypothetical protein